MPTHLDRHFAYDVDDPHKHPAHDGGDPQESRARRIAWSMVLYASLALLAIWLFLAMR